MYLAFMYAFCYHVYSKRIARISYNDFRAYNILNKVLLRPPCVFTRLWDVQHVKTQKGTEALC